MLPADKYSDDGVNERYVNVVTATLPRYHTTGTDVSAFINPWIAPRSVSSMSYFP